MLAFFNRFRITMFFFHPWSAKMGFHFSLRICMAFVYNNLLTLICAKYWYSTMVHFHTPVHFVYYLDFRDSWSIPFTLHNRGTVFAAYCEHYIKYFHCFSVFFYKFAFCGLHFESSIRKQRVTIIFSRSTRGAPVPHVLLSIRCLIFWNQNFSRIAIDKKEHLWTSSLSAFVSPKTG